MSQEFYTLEEAAKRLGLTTQELNAMAQHREIRAFADRGTWRFRSSDVDELATRRGFVSNPNFRLSDPDMNPDLKGPSSNLFVEESAKAAAKDVQGKKSGDTGRVDLGAIAGEEDDVPSSSSFVFGNKPVPGVTDTKGPDSGDEESKVPLGRESYGTAAGDSRVRLDSPSGRLPDMGVHLVDFNMKPISDPPSSRKLVPPPIPGSTPSSGKITTGGSGAIKAGDSGRVSTGGSGRIPQPPKKGDTGRLPSGTPTRTPGGTSSEFDLKPTDKGPQDSIFDFSTPSMDNIELEVPSGHEFADIGGGTQKPEQGGSMRAKLPPAMKEDSDSFELNLDPSSGEDMSSFSMATPTPRPMAKPKDTSSEFDLSLQVPEQSSSDFELSVDASDESSDRLSALASSVDKSGSSTARIPTQDVQVGEDSDFELALDDDAIVDETGSEVVVIDEEGTEPVGAAAGEEAIVEPYEEDEEAEEQAAPARSAEWGWLALLHVPTTLILLFTGMLLFEMVRSIAGYQTSNAFTGAIYELVKKAWAGS